MKKSSLDIYKSRLEKAFDYVAKHLDQKILLEDLAKETFFSSYHFHRIFTSIQNESVNEYITRIKLEKASQQLLYTNKPIKEIAFSLGYSSNSTFTRAFSNYFECSPKNYRDSGISKNSKICKLRYDISEHLCQTNNTKAKIEVKQLDFNSIAYLEVKNSFQNDEAQKALSYLIEWSKKVNMYQNGKLMGFSPDDIMVTPKSKYRYFVGISIPSDFTFEHVKIKKRDVKECKYACTHVNGTIEDVVNTWAYLYNQWLPSSNYEPEHTFNFEFFCNKTQATNWSSYELELAVPIKKLTI